MSGLISAALARFRDLLATTTGAGLSGFSHAVTYPLSTVGQAVKTASSNKVRDTPAAYAWAGIVPTICMAVGRAQASETVSGYALRINAGLIGAGSVWVDPVNGNDAGSGSHTDPVKTLANAIKVKNPSLVYCLPGEYRPFDFRSTDSTSNKLKIVRAMGPCTIREAADDPKTATWTADPTFIQTYWMPLTPGNKIIQAVLDLSRMDEEGQPMPFVKYSSIATVNAGGSGPGWFQDIAANRLYFRGVGLLVNVNTIKGNLKIVTGDASSKVMLYGAKMLMQGQWHLEGVCFQPLNVGGVTPATLYLDVDSSTQPTVAHCMSHGLDSLGADTYMQGAWLHRNKGDNFHYTDSSGLPSRSVEINCKGTKAGDIDTELAAPNTSNGSSTHAACSVLRINGVYRRNWGPDIVDTGTGASWSAGTVSGPGAPSGNDFGIYTTGPVMRLDCCASFDHAQADIATVTNGQLLIYSTAYRTSSIASGGTITDYTP